MTDAFSTETDEDLPEGFVINKPVEDDDVDLDAMFAEIPADFSLMYPPDGSYNAIVQLVEHRQKINESGPNQGRLSRGWNLSVQLDCPNPAQAPFNGSFQNKYIWFGFDKDWSPQGLQQLCNFLEAVTGESWEDRNVDLKSFNPERRDVRGKSVVVMSFFDKVPVLVKLKTMKKLNKQTEEMEKRTEIVGFASPVPYDPDAEVPEAGF